MRINAKLQVSSARSVSLHVKVLSSNYSLLNESLEEGAFGSVSDAHADDRLHILQVLLYSYFLVYFFLVTILKLGS